MSNALTYRNLNIAKFQRLALSVGFACATLASTSALQAEDLAPLNIKLPNPAFVGTKVELNVGPNVEPLQTNRAPFMAPKDVVNLAAGKKVTSSDPNKAQDELNKIVDGNKNYESEAIVLLRKGVQWVQVDLGQSSEIFAIVLWHAHDTAKVYKKVIVQLSDKEDFSGDVQTIFNNDLDNTANRGIGKDKEYFETNLGKLIDAKGAKGRYVRCYSKGSTDSSMNEYTELEVYGRPAK